MAIVTLVSRKVGASDIAFGTGAFSWTDENGVSHTMTEVNASHIPLTTYGTVQQAIGWIPTVNPAYGVAYAGSTNTVLYFAAGSYSVTANLVVPANVVLRMEPGAVITVPNGVTLTLNTEPQAGLYQIFSCAGTGAVVLPLSATAYPQWWGAVGDGLTDDSVAIQAAISSGAGTVYCPVVTATAFVPGSISKGTYNLGTTQLVINRAMRFLMPHHGAFTYSGATGPFLIDTENNYISGLELKIGSVKSTGSYCIFINANGTLGELENSCIEAGWLQGFVDYGFRLDTCGAYNKIFIHHTLAGQAAPQNAWAVYYAKTYIGATSWEANEIHVKSVYNSKGFFGDVSFKSNQVYIDYDGGTVDEPNKIDTAGFGNIFYVHALAGALAAKTDCIILRSTAEINTFIGAPFSLVGIRDEGDKGSNMFPYSPGVQNLLKNPSFESWGCLDGGVYAPTDWTLANCNTTTYEATERRHGRYSAKIITDAGGYACIYQALPTLTTATVTGWFMAPATNTKTACIQFTETGGGFGSNAAIVPKDGKWHFLSTSYTFTGTAPVLRLYANVTADNTAGEILYADGITVNTGLNNPVFPEPICERVLYAEGAYVNAALANASYASVTLNCLGAVVGDPVAVSCTDATGTAAGLIYNAHVSSADHVVVTIYNHTAAPVAINGIIRIAVHRDGF